MGTETQEEQGTEGVIGTGEVPPVYGEGTQEQHTTQTETWGSGGDGQSPRMCNIGSRKVTLTLWTEGYCEEGGVGVTRMRVHGANDPYRTWKTQARLSKVGQNTIRR